MLQRPFKITKHKKNKFKSIVRAAKNTYLNKFEQGKHVKGNLRKTLTSTTAVKNVKTSNNIITAINSFKGLPCFSAWEIDGCRFGFVAY